MDGDKLHILLISDSATDYQQLTSLLDRRSRVELHWEQTLPSPDDRRHWDVWILADRLSSLLPLSLSIPIVLLADVPETEIPGQQAGIADYWLREELTLAFVNRSLRSLLEIHQLKSQNRSLTEELAKYKHIEQTFRESEARLLELLSNTSDGILIIDLQGSVRFANPVAAKLFNCSLNELVGSEFGLPVMEGESAELNLLRAEGEWGIGEMRVAETEWQSEPVYAIALRDITERREAETALRESKERFQQMADNIQDVFWLASPGLDRWFYVSPAYERIWGQSRDLLYTDPASWLAAVHPEDREVACTLLNPDRFESPNSCEYRVQTSNSQIRWICARIFPIHDERRKIVRLAGIWEDITQRKQAELALEASRSRLAGILEIADDAIISINIHQQIALFNRGAEKIFGYNSEEVMGKSLNLLLPEFATDIDQQDADRFARAADGIGTMGDLGTIVGRRKKGEEFPVEASISLLEIDGEKIFTIILRDISDRQQAAERLQRSQHFIERVADASPSLLYIYDLIENKNVYLNGDLGVLGYSSEEIHAMGDRLLQEILHPEDLELWPQRRQRFQKANDGDVIKTEYRIRHKQGQWRWLYSRDIIFSRTSHGSPKEILGVAVDISDRKEVEAQLQEYRERLEELVERRTNELLEINQQLQQEIQERKQARSALYFQARLLDMVDHAVIATDLMGTITYWNRGAQILYGRLAAETIGRNILDAIPSNTPRKNAAEMMQSLYRGESWYGEFQVKQRDGREFPAMVIDSPVYNEAGELVGIVEISFDNSERKQAEEALRKANAELGITVEQTTRDLGGAIEKLQQEIVKRKLAETELQESEERFRVVLQTSPVVVFHQDINLYYTWIYNTFKPFTPKDFIGRRDEDLFDPETAERLNRIKQGVLESGKGTRVETSIFYNGRVLYYDMTFEPLRFRSGRIIGLTGAAIEITHRKEAEETLRQQMERERLLGQIARHVRQSLQLDDILNTTAREVRQLLSADRVLIFRYYPENKGIITHESIVEGQECLLGLEIQEEVLHRDCYQNYYQGRARILSLLNENEEMPDCLRDYLQVLGIKSSLVVPLLQQSDLWGLLIVHQCQTTRQWQPWETTLLEQLAVQVAIAIQQAELYRQLSEKLDQEKQVQLQLQQAKEAADTANRAKSEFLANMSHELRTPLNAILGFTQIMARSSLLPSEEQEYVEIISRSGEHLLSLINDILDLSKIEAGRISLDLEGFDLFELLDNLQSMLQLKAESKGLSLTFHRSAELPQFIQSDRKKLRSTLINLIGNAIKFTERGSISVSVTSHQSPVTNPITIRFVIEDTGVGIAPEELETLFDAFVQTNSRQKTTEGTGLGLTISRHFARLLGGDIEVESTLGRGSMFAFSIACFVVEKQDASATSSDRRIIGLESGEIPYRILIVEDRWTNRRLLRELLVAIGFTCREATNGREAIAFWQEWQPHLIFMDMQMPVLDGYEATRAIRLQEEATGQGSEGIPIIALTASAFESQRPSILAAGCDDLIVKPFSENDLLEKIALHLGVRYRYENIADASFSLLSASPSVQLTPADLQQLSLEERSQLHQLALCARGRQLRERIEEFLANRTELQQALLSLVDNLHFERIIELIELAGVEEKTGDDAMSETIL
ncbi:MAG: PAS domain S-box protein [Cyanobacteria bacterium SBLK]|nr:PAS domain S-box protein [Cyanobacteria bacterium SBLK]